MQTFNIIKKNRKYFAATTSRGYKCKILIDDNSESLKLGEQSLEVDDISVRSKYGTDLIFKLSASVEEQKDAGICTLRTPLYNKKMVERCKALGGKWDAEEKAWVFSGLVENEVDELDDIYNSDLIGVEIHFIESAYGHQGPLELAGFTIAKAHGRDSGATLSDGVALIEGSVSSGGSQKNWTTVAQEGSVIRMRIPEMCFAELEGISGIKVQKL